MTDFLGNEVHIGDEVVYLNHYRTSSHLEMGTVSGIAPKTAYIGGKRRKGSKIINLSSLRAQQERENPKPLTLDELRGMVGQPVWVTHRDGSGGRWGIVNSSPFGLHANVCAGRAYWFDDFIGTIAYRRKPEEG